MIGGSGPDCACLVAGSADRSGANNHTSPRPGFAAPESLAIRARAAYRWTAHGTDRAKMAAGLD